MEKLHEHCTFEMFAKRNAKQGALKTYFEFKEIVFENLNETFIRKTYQFHSLFFVFHFKHSIRKQQILQYENHNRP